MKRVPANEFADHAADYLEGTEEISVEKDGEVIGRYVPVTNGHPSNGTHAHEPRRKISPEARENLECLNRTLQAVYA